MKLSHIMRFMFVSAIYLAGSGVALAADASTATGGTTGTTAGASPSASATTTGTNSTGGSVAPATSQTQLPNRIAVQFSSFAGSTDNADNLALGLWNGTPVTLSAGGASQSSPVTFDPPTGHMGWGNVTRALTLAQRELAALGVTQPTPEQLKVALMGGTITTVNGSTVQTVTLPGVLRLRSQGMGWGQIAHTIGVHPGNRGGLSAGASSTVGTQTVANTSVGNSGSAPTSGAARGRTERETGIEGADGLTTAASASAFGLATAAGASGGASSHSQHGAGIVRAGGGSGVAFSGQGRQSSMVTGAGRADGGLGVGRGRGKE